MLWHTVPDGGADAMAHDPRWWRRWRDRKRRGRRREQEREKERERELPPPIPFELKGSRAEEEK